MDEEVFEPLELPQPQYEPIPVCRCLKDSESSEKIKVSSRKHRILNTVTRTEEYLRKRRIPELIRFLLTKVLADGSNKPLAYLEKLIDDCMLYRSGLGPAPVLYEKRHLEAVVKSFDPGQRGWLTAGQIRRAYTTLGLTLDREPEERTSCYEVLRNLIINQEERLYNLLSAGLTPPSTDSSETSSTSNDLNSSKMNK